MSIRPIHDRVLVQAQDVETQTSGGIIIANAKNEGIVEGYVVAVGPGNYDDKGKFVETTVNVGNRILFHIGSGEKINHEDEEYVMLPEYEIIAVLS